MVKKSENPRTIIKKRDDTATIVAEKYRVTDGYVRKVINGKRNNPAILATYIEFKQAKNKLIQAVERLVPFE